MRVLAAVSSLTLLGAGAAGATEIARGAVAQDGWAFVTSADGTLAALDVATGAVRWSSPRAMRPLAVEGARLLAQSSADEGQLGLAFIDAASGRVLGEAQVALPPGVSAPLDDTEDTRFAVRTDQAGPRVRLEWTWDYRPMRGAYEEDEDGTSERAGPRREQGAIEVDLAASRASAAQSRAAAGPEPLPAALAREADLGTFRERPRSVGAFLVATQATVNGPVLKRWRPDGAAWPDVALPADLTLQLGSADGRQLLLSREIAGAPLARAHEWVVIALETGARVATLRTSTAAAAFATAGSRVLVAHQPWEHRAGSGWRSEPRRLEAFDRASGAQAWTREIRDGSYHGPFAP